MSLKISRILHAGYVYECEGTQIAFDTIFENPFSRNCHAFPNVEFDLDKIKRLRFSAVFISHFHDDHCSMESLNLLDRETPIYIYCVFEEMITWIKGLGFEKVYSLKLNESVLIGPFEVIPRRALDAEVDSLFQVKVAGMNVLNVVDSWIDYETLDLLVAQGPWDMVMWPFQTMREIEVICPSQAEPALKELPAEWIEQLQALNPRYIVPSSCQFKMESWSWYNQAFFPISYREFRTQIELALPQAKVCRLNPGVSVVLGKSGLKEASPLDWIAPIGPQDVDYEYEPSPLPPPTSEIAQHFAALTSDQEKIVYDFCQSGIIEKYKSMDPPADIFFNKRREWRLSVFDHEGRGRHFCYSLNENDMQLSDSEKKPSWTTEVPLAKLYAALQLGESLTSMYMRINVTEAVDIVEDPLMRCLFNGAFGAYQLAQLKRIAEKAALN